MKRIISLALLLFAVNCFAATEVNYFHPLPEGATRLGSVSYENPTAVPSELVAEISRKAEKMGGKYYKITSFEVAGNSRASAVVYR